MVEQGAAVIPTLLNGAQHRGADVGCSTMISTTILDCRISRNFPQSPAISRARAWNKPPLGFERMRLMPARSEFPARSEIPAEIPPRLRGSRTGWTKWCNGRTRQGCHRRPAAGGAELLI